MSEHTMETLAFFMVAALMFGPGIIAHFRIELLRDRVAELEAKLSREEVDDDAE